jgi:uncharacterized protein YkwD
MRSCTKVLETPPKKLVLTLILTLALALVAVAGMPKGAGADPALDGEEQAFLTIINSYRTQNGLGALSLNTQLTNAADWMSNDMAAKCYFSHTDSLGRDPFQRMAAFGYNYNTWKGENLAAGTTTAQAAFDAWKNSPLHDANMLNPNFTVIGIARASGTQAPCLAKVPPGIYYQWYWTNDFGGQGSAPPPPAEPTTPPPAPPPPAPTQPAPTPEPTQEPTPEPTPEVTPEPTPIAPNRDDIQSQLSEALGGLNLVGIEDSVLRYLSYIAERYLVASNGLLVQGTGDGVDVRVADVKTGELWLAIFKG